MIISDEMIYRAAKDSLNHLEASTDHEERLGYLFSLLEEFIRLVANDCAGIADRAFLADVKYEGKKKMTMAGVDIREAYDLEFPDEDC